MSLPHRFQTTVDSVPSRFPYLTANPERVEAWRGRLGQRQRMRVGLSWWGSKARGVDTMVHKNRSVPLAGLASLLELPAEFHSLQQEYSTEDAAILPTLAITSHNRDLGDFGETAALMANMDLVISIDTSVAHAAGALGRPLWMLLPFYSDYRWRGPDGASPWYPHARLFRQHTPGDWDAPVAAATAALNLLLREGHESHRA